MDIHANTMAKTMAKFLAVAGLLDDIDGYAAGRRTGLDGVSHQVDQCSPHGLAIDPGVASAPDSVESNLQLFGLSLEQFAALNAAWAASIVLLEVPSGALADTVGRANLLRLAGVLMVAEMVLICFVPLGDPDEIVFHRN